MRRLLFLLISAVLTVAAADLSGKWQGTLETDRGTDQHSLALQQNGNAVTGTVAFSDGKWEIRNAKLTGTKLGFEITVGSWVLHYDLQVSGNEISGTVKADSGPFPGGKVRFQRGS